jgi:hypothetical protein
MEYLHTTVAISPAGDLVTLYARVVTWLTHARFAPTWRSRVQVVGGVLVLGMAGAIATGRVPA